VISSGPTHSGRSNLYLVVVVLNHVEPMTIRDILIVPNELKRGIGVYLDGEEEVALAEPCQINVKEHCAVMFFDLRVNSREGVVWQK